MGLALALTVFISANLLAASPTSTKKQVATILPTGTLENISNPRFFRSATGAWIEGSVRLVEGGNYTPFQMRVTSSTPDRIEAKGKITHKLCNEASCGLPYQLTFTRVGKYGFEVTEEIPTTVPSTIEEFTKLKDFAPQERIVEDPVYLLAPEGTEFKGSFAAATYALGGSYTTDVKIEAPEDAATGLVSLNLNLNYPSKLEYYPTYPEHECKSYGCPCTRWQSFPATYSPTPVVTSAVLVSPSNKRVQVAACVINRECSSPIRFQNNGWTTATATSFRNNGLIEEPINGTWRVELQFEDQQRKCPVAYSVQASGTLTIMPLKTTF